MITISLDDRERVLNSIFISKTPKLPTDIIVKRLTIGDIGIYINNKLVIVIERKTWDDLASSIKDGRIDRQLSDLLKLRNINKVSIFIFIEGRPARSHQHIEKKNLDAKINHIMIRDQIPIIFTDNPEKTVVKILSLSDSLGTIKNVIGGDTPGDLKLPEKAGDPLVFKREYNYGDAAKTALTAFRSVSFVTASLILAKFSIVELYDKDVVKENIIAGLSYSSGAKIGAKREREVLRQLNDEKCAIKLLSNIKGIKHATAEKIISEVGMNLSLWTIDNLKNVSRGKNKLGPSVSEKIIKVINYKLTL